MPVDAGLLRGPDEATIAVLRIITKKKYLKDEENAICESGRIFLYISGL